MYLSRRTCIVIIELKLVQLNTLCICLEGLVLLLFIEHKLVQLNTLCICLEGLVLLLLNLNWFN